MCCSGKRSIEIRASTRGRKWGCKRENVIAPASRRDRRMNATHLRNMFMPAEGVEMTGKRTASGELLIQRRAFRDDNALCLDGSLFPWNTFTGEPSAMNTEAEFLCQHPRKFFAVEVASVAENSRRWHARFSRGRARL